MAAPNRPQFFCTRPDGTLTPLLAADDLPLGLTVQGLPRVLDAGETQGMISCGVAAPRSEPWTIEGVAHVFPHDLGKESHGDLQHIMVQIIHDHQVPPHIRLAVQAILYRAIDFPAGLPGEDSSNSTVMSPLGPNFMMNPHVGKNGFNSKKEYCSYWIRHGECDYAQQGCLYKHEMPLEAAMLEKLGLRDIPRWYREKHNVPSLLYQSSNNRQQLSLTDQPQMRALTNSSPDVNGSTDGKASTVTGKLIKTPPRGPANHSSNGGFNSQNRGGNRNGNFTGQFAGHGWKGGRNVRNRNVSSSPQTKSTVSERSTELSPRATRFDVSQLGGYLPTDVGMTTAATAAHVTTAAPVFPVVPMVPNMSLLDDSNARNRTLAFRANELARIDETGFDKISHKPSEPQIGQSDTRHMYAHTSNPSSDGGVMLPKEITQPYAPNFDGGSQSTESTRKLYGALNTPSTANAACGSSPAALSNLVATQNVPLGAMDTRVTWGPIGGPIMKSASPPTDPRAVIFGQYPVKTSSH